VTVSSVKRDNISLVIVVGETVVIAVVSGPTVQMTRYLLTTWFLLYNSLNSSIGNIRCEIPHIASTVDIHVAYKILYII